MRPASPLPLLPVAASRLAAVFATAVAAIAVVATAGVARADPATLRLATIAPQGSGWAREFSAWARDVEAGTHGAVRIKMYYSAIGGDEFTVLDRIKRDQLDGGIGSESCTRLGALAARDAHLRAVPESRGVVLRPRAAGDEARCRVLARRLHQPRRGDARPRPAVHARSRCTIVDELQKTLLWIWNADEALAVQAQALGMHVVATPLDGAARAYEDKSVDGFIAMPTAALAFQWSAEARYLVNLALSYRNGCVFIASRAFDPLPIETQRYIRTATAKLRQRLDDMNTRQDDALVGGLFARQGLRTVPVSDSFRLDFFNQARDMRERVAGRLVPPEAPRRSAVVARRLSRRAPAGALTPRPRDRTRKPPTRRVSRQRRNIPRTAVVSLSWHDTSLSSSPPARASARPAARVRARPRRTPTPVSSSRRTRRRSTSPRSRTSWSACRRPTTRSRR